jgi:hypothetical protein
LDQAPHHHGRCKAPHERQFYSGVARKFGWTKNVLAMQIENQTFEKTRQNQTHFGCAVPAKYRDQAKLAVTDLEVSSAASRTQTVDARRRAVAGEKADEELAERLGRTQVAVTAWQERLGIPCKEPKCKPWSKEEEQWLGTDLDENIAKRLGRNPKVVSRRRKLLRIAAFGRKFWSREEEALRGALPDPAAAKPMAATNYRLYSIQDLAQANAPAGTNLYGPTAFWSRVSAAPVVVNGQNVLTETSLGTEQFYQLRPY